MGLVGATRSRVAGGDRHPRSVYVKEEAVVRGLDGRLAGLFDDEHVDHTCEVLAGAAEPDPDYEVWQAELEAKIRATATAGWPATSSPRTRRGRGRPDCQVDRRGPAGAQEPRNLLGRSVPGGELTKAEIKALVVALRDIVGVLGDADPPDKAELYAELGVRLAYHPDGRVAVEALPRGLDVRVGGGT